MCGFVSVFSYTQVVCQPNRAYDLVCVFSYTQDGPTGAYEFAWVFDMHRFGARAKEEIGGVLGE